MRRNMRVKKVERTPMGWLFVIGFLIGVLIPNIMWKEVYLQASVVEGYLLECLGDLEYQKEQLLYEVIKKRAGMAILTGICGISIFGVPVSIIVMMIQAFEFGCILTSSILQFGVQGGLVGISLLLPQGIIYFIAMYGICTIAFFSSREVWRNQNIFNKHIYKYLVKWIVLLICMAVGIFLETYVGPEFTKFVIGKLKIFS